MPCGLSPCTIWGMYTHLNNDQNQTMPWKQKEKETPISNFIYKLKIYKYSLYPSILIFLLIKEIY